MLAETQMHPGTRSCMEQLSPFRGKSAEAQRCEGLMYFETNPTVHLAPKGNTVLQTRVRRVLLIRVFNPTPQGLREGIQLFCCTLKQKKVQIAVFNHSDQRCVKDCFQRCRLHITIQQHSFIIRIEQHVSSKKSSYNINILKHTLSGQRFQDI